MRKIALILSFVYVGLLLPGMAHAQTVQIFGGYSYLRPGVMPGFATHPNLSGWEAAGTYNPLKWLGVTGDFSGNYGTLNGVGIHLQNYLFGPQVRMPGRIAPFAHVLIGESRGDVLGTSASSTAFALQFGGGIDISEVPAEATSFHAPSLSFRPIQIDELVTQFGSATQHSLRVSIGLVLNF